MASYKCAKCGILGNSKCAGQRSMFLIGADTEEGRMNEMLVGMISNYITYGQSKGFTNTFVPTLVVPLHVASYPLNRELNEEEREDRRQKAITAGSFYPAYGGREPTPKYDLYERIPVDPPKDHEAQQARVERATLDFFKTIRSVSEDVLKQAVCDHNWELQDVKCELGCCKRRKTKKEPA